MMSSDLLKQSKAKAKEWLDGNIDVESKAQVSVLLNKEDPRQLIDSFYRSLEFCDDPIDPLCERPLRLEHRQKEHQHRGFYSY